MKQNPAEIPLFDSASNNFSAPILDTAKKEELWGLICIKYDLPKSQTLEETSIKTLADIMNTYYADEKSKKVNRKEWMRHVARPEIIRKDIKSLHDSFYWSPDDVFSYFLSIRAGEGRAHSGHGMHKKVVTVPDPKTKGNIKEVFVQNPKVNTTIDEIIQESGVDRHVFGKISEESIQNLVNPIITYLNDIENILDSSLLEEEKIEYIKNITSDFKLLDENGGPLMGYPFLHNTPIDPMEFMRGFYFASQMDNYERRRKVFLKYGHEMGGGECYAINRERLKDFGINFKELAKEQHNNWILDSLSHKKRIKLLKEIGIIVDTPKNYNVSSFEELLEQGIPAGRHSNDMYVNNGYIRQKKGAGVSDDIAIVLAALLPPLHNEPSYLQNPQVGWISRFIGAHFADLIDTIDKTMNVVLPGGVDEALGNMLNERFKEIYHRPEMRKALGITMPQNNHELISDTILTDYIAVSANVLGRDDVEKEYSHTSIHSSARYFLSEHCDYDEVKDEYGPATCTFRELLAWTQDYVTKRDELSCEILEKNDEDNLFLAKKLKVGFTSMPIKIVKDVLSVAGQLVADPNHREHRIRTYFNTIFDKKKYTS